MAEVKTPMKDIYEEFEPFCKWQKDEVRDTVEIHLQGFKKEQLRVQLNNLGVMRINGERLVDDHKRTRFQKEITVPKDVKTNEIGAKFSNGILYIIMPKQTPQTFLQNQQIILTPKTQESEPKNPKMGTEAVPEKTVNNELDGKENSMIRKDSYGSKENKFVLKVEINRRIVTVAFALLVAIGVFIMYFRSSNFKM